jgi:hypothetical protein
MGNFLYFFVCDLTYCDYHFFPAFLLGLTIGLVMAIYNFITLKSQSMKNTRRIRELEEELSALRGPDVTGEADGKYDEKARQTPASADVE